jgi:DNA polymerase-1
MYRGFGGDTLHMARMYDTSKLPNEFSLNKLSEIYHEELLKMRNYYISHFKKVKHNDSEWEEKMKTYEKFNNGQLRKTDMKQLFQYKKILASGEEGKSWSMPTIEDLHTDSKYLKDWIKYSVIDAEVTYYLRDALQILLQSLSTKTITHKNPVGSLFKDNYQLYLNYWRPFGELMTDMEREGIRIDVNYLRVK